MPNHFAKVCKRGSRVHLVEKESSTPPESEKKVLLISVGKVGKKLLAQVQCTLQSRWEDPDNCVPTRHCSILQSVGTVRLSKLGNLPVQESGTILTMYDGTVRKSLLSPST